MATKEGDPTLESLETSPEEEEITLSDSELDDVLSSAEIDSEDTLEQYGVWVKAGPQDIGASAESDAAFELADLEPGKGSEATLTEEEERLLGELEEDSEIGEGLSVLEDDLEELGRGAPAPEQGLGLEVEEGGSESLELEEMPEDFPDLEAETLQGLDSIDAGAAPAAGADRDSEIEVPLSDRAAVEEHYEDLAPLESVPSTPGMSPPNILERIEKDLNQIKAEIQSLKNELAGFAGGASRKAEAKPQAAEAASFEKGDDDTIALTGDELDNILNTADITEEAPSGGGLEEVDSADALEALQGPEELELEEEPAGPKARQPSEPEIDLESLPELGGAPELAAAEDILEPGTLDLTEEPLAELETPAEAAELEPAGDIGEIELAEEVGPGLTEEVAVEEAGSAAPVEELEGADALEELEIPELEPEGALLEPAAPAVEELSLAEEAPAAAEAEIEELGLAEEAPVEAAAGLEAVEPVESLQPAESIPEIELAAEELRPGPPAAAPAAAGGVASLSKELQSDIRSVLSYLDQLLEALPNEKIQEFAQSQYFGIYKRLFDELGLGA